MPVPDSVKEEHWHRLMRRAQAISRQRLKRHIGRGMQVIIDAIGPTVAKGGANGRAKGRAKGRGNSVGRNVTHLRQRPDASEKRYDSNFKIAVPARLWLNRNVIGGRAHAVALDDRGVGRFKAAHEQLGIE
jgi:hypothetical protein